MKVNINRVNLIKEMAIKRITNIELAEKACVSRAVISGMRNGKRCNENTVKHVANALGVDASYLIEAN